MALTKESVKKALEKVILPAIGKNLVQMNFIKNIIVDGSKVQVTLELKAPHTAKKDFIYSESMQVLTQTPGVESVKIDIQEKTANKPQEKPAMDISNLDKVKNIIGVASGKGGVGKSTVTANLAMSLAMDGFKVGILDADIYGPSMNLMFAINEAPIVNEDKTVYPVVVEKGIKIISMAMFSEADKAVIWRGPMAAQMIQNFIEGIAELDLTKAETLMLINLRPSGKKKHAIVKAIVESSTERFASEEELNDLLYCVKQYLL